MLVVRARPTDALPCVSMMLLLVIVLPALHNGRVASGSPPQSSPLPPLRVSRGAPGGNAKFVVATTGAHFVPRGANFIRLNGSQGVAPPQPVYHSTFSPRFYAGNRSAAAKALDDLHAHGYNIVRVFVDGGGWTRYDGVNGQPVDIGTQQPLSAAYLANVADFIRLAASKGVYTTVTLNGLPNNAYFRGRCNATLFGYPNRLYLDQTCINAKAEYARLFLLGLTAKDGDGANGGLLGGLAWLSLENEAYFSTAAAPFSRASGVVHTADGHAYDMAEPAQRQQAADSNMLLWTRTVSDAVRPFGVMVGVGMFTFSAVGKPAGPRGLPLGTADTRFPFRPLWLASGAASGLDLLDVHVYQVPDWPGMAADLATSEWPRLSFEDTPIVMGEFGAWRQHPDVFANGTSAAAAMVRQQVEACRLNMTGSMFWTYDTAEQPRLWNFQSAPEIAAALSPQQRPDGCSL